MKCKVTSTIVSPRMLGDMKLKEFINRKSMEWTTSVKEIIRNEAMDTGDFLNSIYTEIGANGFVGGSSVDYAKYWEFGTEPHFVPFYDQTGNPVLAEWGRRVLKLTPEEMRKMGGITVSTPELAPMRRSLAKL